MTVAPPGPGRGPVIPPGRRDPTARHMLRTWVIVGVAVVGFSGAALVLTAYYGAAFGVRTTLLALLLAALPLGIVVPTFLWLDRFESEPRRFLVAAFLWGALVATLIAATINTGAMSVLRATSAAEPDAAMAATAVLVAPVVEEAAKGVYVLIAWRFLRREFDGVTDGMVYAGITAAGFAFTENIQYLGAAYLEGGGQALTATFLGRGVMSPFAHPMFTVLIGIGVGLAASTRSRAVKVLAPLGGYALAVLAHGLWNLAAVSGASGLLVVYVFVLVPIFVAFVVFVVAVRRHEGRLIGRFLVPYAHAGWLTPAEVAMLASMSRRRQARAWARATGGPPALRSMRAFQDTASELALLRRRMSHSAADPNAVAAERELLGALWARRLEFAPPIPTR